MSFLKDFKDLKKDISVAVEENATATISETVAEPVQKSNVGESVAEASDVTVIAEGAVIHGDMESAGSISVHGTIYGHIKCAKKLIVTGRVLGNLTAGEIFINKASVDGEVVSEGNLKIGSGSVVLGDIYGKTAVIAGAIKGEIDIKGPVIIDNTAVVKGNIKSSSVQINNGAVIEGYCTQCYHDIDVNAIFNDTFPEKAQESVAESVNVQESSVMQEMPVMPEEMQMNSMEEMPVEDTGFDLEAMLRAQEENVNN